MLDIEWERLIHRKDLIDLGEFALRVDTEDLGNNKSVKKLVLEKKNVASLNNDVITFYASEGLITSHTHVNYYMYTDSVILTSLSDQCLTMRSGYLDSGDVLEEYIPYDQTCDAAERKVAVDFTVDNKFMRDMMYNVIDFQALRLKNIDFVVYNFHRGVDLENDYLYNYFTSRPLFRRYRIL